MNVSNISPWAAILGIAATGFIWVGSHSADLATLKEKTAKLEQLPVDVAVLKSQSDGHTKALEEIKAQTKEIVESLRRRDR